MVTEADVLYKVHKFLSHVVPALLNFYSDSY